MIKFSRTHGPCHNGNMKFCFIKEFANILVFKLDYVARCQCVSKGTCGKTFSILIEFDQYEV